MKGVKDLILDDSPKNAKKLEKLLSKDPGSAAEIGHPAVLSGEDKISEKDGVRAERKCIPGSITGTLVPQLCKCR